MELHPLLQVFFHMNGFAAVNSQCFSLRVRKRSITETCQLLYKEKLRVLLGGKSGCAVCPLSKLAVTNRLRKLGLVSKLIYSTTARGGKRGSATCRQRHTRNSSGSSNRSHESRTWRPLLTTYLSCRRARRVDSSFVRCSSDSIITAPSTGRS